MPSENEYKVTPSHLAVLGILDEVYTAYKEINDLYMGVINNNVEPRFGRCTWDESEIRNYCVPKVKKILNAFYLEHLSMFTTEYEIIFANSNSLIGIDFYIRKMSIAKDIGYYIYNYKPISFQMFLFYLRLIVARVIVQRKKQEGIIVNIEKIMSEIDLRILSLSSQAFLNRKTTYCDTSINRSGLIVYKSLNSIYCRINQHTIDKTERLIPLIGSSHKAVLVPIHKCKTCGREFIGLETYKAFTGEYGHLVFERLYEENDRGSGRFSKYAAESKLHKLGYSVIDGELSENERHRLLVQLLENKWMTYFEMCKDIENAISIFDGRDAYLLAIKKWRDDLKYIGEYKRALGHTSIP